MPGIYSDAYIQRLLTLRLSRSTLRASKSRHMNFYNTKSPSEAQIGPDRPIPLGRVFGPPGDPQETLREPPGSSRKPSETSQEALRNLQEASGSSHEAQESPGRCRKPSGGFRKRSESSRKLSGSSREALRKFPGSSRRPALYHNIFRE